MKIEVKTEQLAADSIVQRVIDRYPQTIPVFAHHRLQCVGCYIAPFHTIADSAHEHAVALEPLLADLNLVLASTEPEGQSTPHG